MSQLLGKQLESDRLLQLEILGAVHLSHSAPADQSDDPVACPQGAPGRKLGTFAGRPPISGSQCRRREEGSRIFGRIKQSLDPAPEGHIGATCRVEERHPLFGRQVYDFVENLLHTFGRGLVHARLAHCRLRNGGDSVSHPIVRRLAEFSAKKLRQLFLGTIVVAVLKFLGVP